MSRYTFGAIDIGSNAIRLLIDYVEEYKKPEFKKAAFVRVPIRLGEDVFSKGYITQEKEADLMQAMSAFAALFRTCLQGLCDQCHARSLQWYGSYRSNSP